MTENAEKAAESTVDWLYKEGLLDESDTILDRRALIVWIGGIIDTQYGAHDDVVPVTLDELEEAEFNKFNERLIDEW